MSNIINDAVHSYAMPWSQGLVSRLPRLLCVSHFHFYRTQRFLYDYFYLVGFMLGISSFSFIHKHRLVNRTEQHIDLVFIALQCKWHFPHQIHRIYKSDLKKCTRRESKGLNERKEKLRLIKERMVLHIFCWHFVWLLFSLLNEANVGNQMQFKS